MPTEPVAHDHLTLTLVQQALDELDDPDTRLTVVMRKALRVARLRNDWEALYWLQLEMDGYSDREVRKQLIAEVAPFFDRETFKALHERTVEQSIARRGVTAIDARGCVDADKMTGLSIPEIDETLAAYTRTGEQVLPSNLHPVDAATLHEERRQRKEQADFSAAELRKVVARIAQRVHTFLSTTERQLVFGQQQADIFETNRRYVNERLGEIAPEVLEQLLEAYRRTRDSSREAGSHALTSCRRALKSLADRLYPPRSTPVRGKDGKERILTDAMFVARLWQFVAEASAGSAAKRILESEVEQLGKQVDRLNELASKGVHDQVTEFEVNMCVLGMYNLASALLRLHDHQSAASVNPDELR